MRVTDFFFESHLPCELVWKTISQVEHWPAIDPQLIEAKLQGYEPQYVRFVPSLYRWHRMRLESYETGSTLALTAKLPKTRVRTTIAVSKRRHGAYVHTRIRFVGALSFFWAGMFMLGYRRRIRSLVESLLAQLERDHPSDAEANPTGVSAEIVRIDSEQALSGPKAALEVASAEAGQRQTDPH